MRTALLVAFVLVLARPGAAADTWTPIRPGVDLLHRTVGGGTPQDIHALRVDLSRPEVSLRASRNVAGAERGVRASTFAQSVGALAAINGDWSDGNTPVGLAIGDGFLWHDHFDNPNIGGQWGWFACDVHNGCDMDWLPRRSEVWWFAPTRSPYRFTNAVGANGVPLIDEGVRASGCYDGCGGDTCRHPRSAVCVEADGAHLWLIVVDGRRSGASGMTCREVRDLAEDLGCWEAAMLDGGGSSTLWVDGSVRNTPSGGSERSVANHLGVIWTDPADPACALHSGAWCEGTRLRTCTGGRMANDGDCAAFGAACQEDGDWAFCVDPRCPGGDGLGAACQDATRIASCNDGHYSEGDCGAFGLLCGSDALGTSCMDPRCAAGPHSALCTDAGAPARCEDGAYSEEAVCSGSVCWAEGTEAGCMDPRCEAGPNGAFCSDEATVARCADGAMSEERCEPGHRCEATGGDARCVPEPAGDDDDSADPADDDDSEPPPAGGDPEQGCGCSQEGGGGAGLLVLSPLLLAWRRRQPRGRSTRTAAASATPNSASFAAGAPQGPSVGASSSPPA